MGGRREGQDSQLGPGVAARLRVHAHVRGRASAVPQSPTPAGRTQAMCV